ncbi:hypothetical protein RJ639_009822 [Escallonia herrerae]|uniref:Phorbol-ester/DAG-type domain-containing protein n=1 Tax=Escallonia herrerae TaxID=1293975 RepID=A0AA88VUT6_9ASTE|nr:hypothetical protein RJ639_009822 [Escallonia herrerae]
MDRKTRTEGEMELQHFNHDHPLLFREFIPNEEEEEEDDDDEHQEEEEEDEKAYLCSGCGELFSGASYGCSRCNFFLHKECAE